MYTGRNTDGSWFEVRGSEKELYSVFYGDKESRHEVHDVSWEKAIEVLRKQELIKV